MIAAVLALALALVQAPIRPEKHPELGLEFPRPASYEPVPTTPTEREIVLYFVDGATAKKRPLGMFEEDPGRAKLMVLWFEPVAAPASKSANPPELHASLAAWVADRMPKWKLRATNERPGKKGWTAQEYELRPEDGSNLPVTGWAFEWKGAERTIAFVGIAPYEGFNDHRVSWLRAAQGCSFSEPREPSMAEVERRYARTSLREIPRRIEVRRRLLRGWGVEDTDDYLVVHHTQDAAMVHRVAVNLQIVRAEYARLFPAEKPITEIGVVRICRDKDEYEAYGGPEGTAGYWQPNARELVLYDAEKNPEYRGKGDAPTFLALYHEAFHQYVHYAAGELAPHAWFGEGWGDYFAGARVQGGKLVAIDPNPWRARYAHDAFAREFPVPLADLLRRDQAKFYDPGTVDACYAEAWSFVWFLQRSERAAAEPAWRGLLDRYYATLRTAWATEVGALDPAQAGKDPALRAAAEEKARAAALDAALSGVDLPALEAAWKEFVRGLK